MGAAITNEITRYLTLEYDLKKVVNLIALLLVWLLMVLFSHDYVAAKMSQNSQQQIQQIESGQHHFQTGLLKLDQVIESFRSHWQAGPAGLVAQTDRPEISLELSGFIISPAIHQAFRVATAGDQAAYEGFFRLELSNQHKQLYFDSNEINLKQLSNAINLNQLQWTLNDLNDSSALRRAINWVDIGQLDALVIRFYPNNAAVIKLTSVAVLQSNSLPMKAKQLSDCDSKEWFGLACSVTNSMRYLDHAAAYQSVASYLHFDSYLPFSAWVLLLLAWLLALYALMRQNSQAGVAAYALLSLVFLSTLMLHQNWLVTYASVISWALMLLVLALVYWQRKVFYTVHNWALPVWFITAFGAVLLLSLTGFEVDFMTSLPMYFLWACIQQLLLGPVFSHYLMRYLQTSRFVTACWVGVLFSIIHTPNHVLMLVTLCAGVAWSYAWLRYQNIYANAFSHALLALLFYQVMPDSWLESARIGVFF